MQKSAQHQSEEYVGVDEEGNLYKRIIAFTEVGLKQSIPFAVQAILEVIFNGDWLANKVSDNNENLIEFGVCVRSIVTENHAANVNAFSALIKITLLMPGGRKRSCRHT